ncbi:MAG: Fibronectin/fibrinogen-binding protein [Labilithrix sp.]|nr:Fibronectin/fibrinogen-binding protein [Labilithrix sp.]
MTVPTDDVPIAIVQEADCSERVVVLRIRVPGRTAFVVVGAARSGGAAGLLPQGARQELWGARLPPGSPRQRAREAALSLARVKAIVGAEVFFEPHVKTVDDAGDAAGEATHGQSEADAGPRTARMRCLRVHAGRVVVTDAATPRGARPFVEVLDDAVARGELEARGITLAKALADDAVEVHRVDLLRMLEKARQRIERRRAAVREDLAKIAQANAIAAQAQWLVGEAARAPRGATKLVVTDWSSGEAVPMEVPLDPAKSAREQVEAMFKRAKRLKLGGAIAHERLAQAEAQAAAITTAVAAVRDAPSLAAMDAATRDAKKRAPRDVVLANGAPGAGLPPTLKTNPGAKGAAANGGRRVPFRTFVARSGRRVLVGKGAADNDALTLKVARPHDLWLHAKDRTGAHVIVALEKGQTCPAEDLVDAAHLAAHFSDARDEKAVDVQYTPRRYVRKPKGSAPGAVVVDREKVLPLRFEAALLRSLLDREEV